MSISSIQSRQNPRIKHLVKLRNGTQRKLHGEFLVEGLRELSYALNCATMLKELYFCTDYFRNDAAAELIDKAQELQIPLVELIPSVFDKITYRENPDGLLGVAPTWETSLESLKLSDNPLIVVADAIEKPGNLGSLMRSVEATGADALILCNPVTDIFNPNVVRASQGLIFSLPLVVSKPEDTLKFLKEKGIHLVATTPQATTIYWDANLQEPTAILMGSEKDGLSPAWLDKADTQVSIPLAGKADSLNIATAAVLTLYEALRQRKS